VTKNNTSPTQGDAQMQTRRIKLPHTITRSTGRD